MRASPSSRRSSRSSTLLRGATLLLLVLSLLPALTPSPAAAQNSYIVVNSNTCDYGTDTANLGYGDLANMCGGFGEFEYVMNGPSGIVQQATFGGSTTYSGLVPSTPGNPYYITQMPVSPTYLPPAAYCTVYDQYGAVITGAYYVDMSNNQTPIELTVDGYYAVCDVYNAAAEQQNGTTGGDAEVYISKWACDEGYYSEEYNDLQANCTTEQEGVTFTIRDFADDAQSDDTGGQPARASFTDWKTGGATITETIPQGYGQSVVFCYAQDEFGNDYPGYGLTYYPSNNGTISIDIPTDPNGGLVSFYCEWFNIYGQTYDEADVFINKWECPEGYYSEAYSDLRDECTGYFEGVDFTIEDEGGDSQTDDTGGQPARASFTPWKTGPATITESIPQGYGEPIVFCWAYDDFNNYMPGYEPAYYPSTNGSIGVDIPAPTGDYIVTFECDWYNLYENDYAGIYVKKYGCPSDWESSWSFEDYGERCLTIVRGAYYTVTGPDNYESEQATGGIDVWWEGLAPGEYEIREQPSHGYEEMAVWCAVGQYDGDEPSDYESVDLSNGGFSWDLDGNEYLDCYWYNLPAQGSSSTSVPRPTGPATIIIRKYTCEEDYDVFQTGANPTQECDEPTDGVTFTLQGGQNSSATSVTGEDGEDEGTATFEDVPAGSYLLKETYPEDVTSAFIWDCTSTVRQFDYPFSPFATIGPDGTIKVSVVAGETLECDWYNVPTGAPQTLNANVRVSVYDCPGSQVNTSQCDPAPSGVVVTLTSDDDEATELETSDEGVASGGVDPGSYELDVDGTICFTDSDAFEQDGSLTVGEEPVTVDVYRCEA